MDGHTKRVLEDLREELELIRSLSETAIERLVRLGVGFGPSSEAPPKTPKNREAREYAIRDLLPQYLLPKLTVVDQGGGLITVTSKWLERPDWDRLNEAVAKMGGRWIPAGKDSRWEVQVP